MLVFLQSLILNWRAELNKYCWKLVADNFRRGLNSLWIRELKLTGVDQEILDNQEDTLKIKILLVNPTNFLSLISILASFLIISQGSASGLKLFLKSRRQTVKKMINITAKTKMSIGIMMMSRNTRWKRKETRLKTRSMIMQLEDILLPVSKWKSSHVFCLTEIFQ